MARHQHTREASSIPKVTEAFSIRALDYDTIEAATIFLLYSREQNQCSDFLSGKELACLRLETHTDTHEDEGARGASDHTAEMSAGMRNHRQLNAIADPMTDATSTRYQMRELVLPRLDNTVRESPCRFGSFRCRILRASVSEFALHAVTRPTRPTSIDGTLITFCRLGFILLRLRGTPHTPVLRTPRR